MEKQKYIRIADHDAIIIFSPIINHSEFKHLKPMSAGFCRINAEEQRVDCFGESIGLGICSIPEFDTLKATGQIFGTEAMIKLI